MASKSLLAVLLLVLVIALGAVSAYELSNLTSAPGSASTTSQGASVGGVFYPDCTTQFNTILEQGYEINTFLSSTSTKVGDELCINVILLNIDGRNLTQSSDERLSISYNVTDSAGVVVDQKTCVATPANSTSSASTIIGSLSCSEEWDTGQALNGAAPTPGNYQLVIQAEIPYEVVQGMYQASSQTQITLTG